MDRCSSPVHRSPVGARWHRAGLPRLLEARRRLLYARRRDSRGPERRPEGRHGRRLLESLRGNARWPERGLERRHGRRLERRYARRELRRADGLRCRLPSRLAYEGLFRRSTRWHTRWRSRWNSCRLYWLRSGRSCGRSRWNSCRLYWLRSGRSCGRSRRLGRRHSRRLGRRRHVLERIPDILREGRRARARLELLSSLIDALRTRRVEFLVAQQLLRCLARVATATCRRSRSRSSRNPAWVAALGSRSSSRSC